MTQFISLFDVRPILSQLTNGHLILTPNQRLASRINKAYALYAKQNNERVVITPEVYSFNHWIDRCWKRLLIQAYPSAISPKPLSSNQELYVWENLLSKSDLGAALLRPSATAKVVASAYQLLIDWQQDLTNDALCEMFLADQDSSVLLEWIKQFDQLCSDNQWLPQARIAEIVLSAIEESVLPGSVEILGIGFEDMTPLQTLLVNKAGQFKHYSSPNSAGKVSVVECDSFNQEISAAAVWSKQILKNDPSATVAIVVPELSQQRQIVERLLLEVYSPEFNQPINETGNPSLRRNLPFNLSAGYPLLEAPVVADAINLLSLALPKIEINVALSICQSPFHCIDTSDMDRPASLISALHDLREGELSTSSFRHLANDISKNHSQLNSDITDDEWLFAEAMIKMATETTVTKLTKKRSLTEWVKIFNQSLTTMGWPGARRLDSIEFQQVTHWQQALQALSAQSLVIDLITFNEALSQLRNILASKIFQPQTEDSSLQVLGTLEAAGLQFSHLWLTSMSEHQWPPAAVPNPLLPLALQRNLAMPHATADRELLYAKNLSHRFIHSANTIIISSPSTIDENPVSISSLFNHFPKATLQQLLGRQLESLLPGREIRRRHFSSKNIENYEGGNAPKLSSDETVTGGSAVFSSQSACPFKAFLKHRLNIKPLSTIEIGLSAADRGSLLHRALELVWQKLKNQQSLLALDNHQLNTLCEDVSRYTLDEFSQSRPKKLGLRYKQLEIIRLKKLLSIWLEIEASRANFEIVSVEAKQQFQFGDLKLQARIDRIDRLSDGSLLIIDYKTGKSTINRWWGERPDEPQLPLYCMLSENEDETVGAIAYAQIRADGAKLIGVGAEDSSETNLSWNDKYQTDSGSTDWAQLKQQWHRILSTLADDFILGKALVDPKSPVQSCQYCHYAPVCRINHQEANV
jgi:probable DNA repair protein